MVRRDRLRARKLKPRTKRSKTKKLLFASVLGGSTIAAGYLGKHFNYFMKLFDFIAVENSVEKKI